QVIGRILQRQLPDRSVRRYARILGAEPLAKLLLGFVSVGGLRGFQPTTTSHVVVADVVLFVSHCATPATVAVFEHADLLVDGFGLLVTFGGRGGIVEALAVTAASC